MKVDEGTRDVIRYFVNKVEISQIKLTQIKTDDKSRLVTNRFVAFADQSGQWSDDVEHR